ncbi:MAG: MFS transporter [Thiobacillaceae bacterium]|nr:MFS transporter [Thiobacillaceae bacterium]
MPHSLRALRARDFRIYFAGQLVSVAGTWMQQIAMAWLAYRLTDSALVLGLLGFASQVPILLFAPLGGVWSDRIDRRRLMMTTQVLAMLQALTLALLAWQGWVSPELLIGLAFVLGCINAVDIPARQSLVVHLVSDRALLPNAIALNSFMMNATRFVGPALAGIIVAWAGEEVCFLLNALSYLAVLVALAALHTRPGRGAPIPAWHALREGLAYTLSHRDIRLFLLLVASVSFLIAPYVVMMPLYARTALGGDARTFGLLVSSAGAGSLMASLFLASRVSIAGLARQVGAAAMLAGMALVAFALNGVALLAYPILMVLGFAVVLVAAGSNTLLQNWVRDDMRGRVMAIFTMAFLGIAPLGSLAMGSATHFLGVRPALVSFGVLAIVAALAHRQRLRLAGSSA